MNELQEKPIDIKEFKFKGYLIEGERYRIDNSNQFFYHLFVYNPKISLTKECDIVGIEAKNMNEVKNYLLTRLK